MSSQSNPTNGSPSSSASRSRLWRTIAISALASLFLVLVLLLSVLVFGRIEGEEFAPAAFQRRTFHYFEVPLVHLQVWPIQRKATTNPLEQWLRSKAFVRGIQDDGESAGGGSESPTTENTTETRTNGEDPTGGEEPKDDDQGEKDGEDDLRWDLVVARRGGRVTAVGDAGILCQYLDARTASGDLYWLAWTRNHQRLAKVTWTAVDQLARQQMYVFVPEVLERARNATDPSRLEAEIARSLADRFLELAVAQQKQQRHRVALELIDDGLSYDPKNPRLLAAQRESRSAVEQDAAN